MSSDFNALVADVALASTKCERAAKLVREAQEAHADTLSDLAAAESALHRAIDRECTPAGAPRARQEPPIATVTPITRAAIAERAENRQPFVRRRCSLCRSPGHRIQRCPETMAKGDYR